MVGVQQFSVYAHQHPNIIGVVATDAMANRISQQVFFQHRRGNRLHYLDI
jgi:hypothetical protein